MTPIQNVLNTREQKLEELENILQKLNKVTEQIESISPGTKELLQVLKEKDVEKSSQSNSLGTLIKVIEYAKTIKTVDQMTEKARSVNERSETVKKESQKLQSQIHEMKNRIQELQKIYDARVAHVKQMQDTLSKLDEGTSPRKS